jgi:NADH-quinone oxidoreductase subunit E
MFSEATLARFAREVAKYPADQKQSAVMACLAIVQQEQGWVTSPEAERGIADYLGMPPIAVHEVTTFYNMYNQQPVGKFKLNVCTNLPCQLRDGQQALEHSEQAGMSRWAAPRRRPVHRAAVRMPGRLRRCAGDAGQRPPDVSFMSNDKLDQLVDLLRAEANEYADARSQSFSAFQATGVETCFHDRHIARRSTPA